jgi:PAS domain S-box-containing protein
LEVSWAAVAGAYESFEGNTTPRNFSPCSLCLKRGSPQLFSHPERYFTYLQAVSPPPVEVLIVPLMLEAQALGTIWIVAHDEQQFDREDARVLTSLADFLAVALSSAQTRQIAEVQRSELYTRKEGLRLIIESAKDYAIFTLDLDGHFQSWNAGAQRLLGYEEAEIIGQHEDIIFTPEDVDRGDPQAELEVALTQGRKENERWHVRKDGSRFWGSGLVMPLRDESDSLQGFLKIMQDKTEQREAGEALRQSETRLQHALVVGRMGSWHWNIPNNEVNWTEGHFTLLGLEPDEVEPSYEAWRRSVHPDDVEAAEASLQQAMERQAIEYYHEYRTVWRDGSVHWTEARGRFSYDADGQPLQMIGVIVDISDRKRAEVEREQLLAREQTAREEAETANRIKDEFLAVLSHELRSPLNPILGWSSLLRNGRLDTNRTAFALETIERNAKLQVQLIEDLLDVSRILRGKLSLKTAPVNLAIVVRSALETVRLSAEAKSIEIQTILDPAVGQVLGDSARLQQVVWNLLSNAIKFTPEHGEVTVRLDPIDSHAQLQVSDTGKGISPDFLPYVFDYFRQADSSTTRQFGGLGLGLAIVRHLVELHGGIVQVESAGIGRGATFTVRIPLLQTQSELVAEPLYRSLQSPMLNNVRVLLVDDDADAREVAAFSLSQSGATVTTVTCAIEAIAAFEQAQFDVLISDIGMPETDGYMLIQQIRAMPRGEQVFAIALTAYAGELNQERAIQAGFEQHLAKPIDPVELIQTIQRSLNLA